MYLPYYTTLAPENKMASIVLTETPAIGSDRGVGEGKEVALKAQGELSSENWEERPNEGRCCMACSTRQGLVQ